MPEIPTRHSGEGRNPGTPIVCFAAVDYWYFNRAHSEIQLMQRVAHTNPVLFVNSIGMRMPLPGTSSDSLGRITRKLKSFLKFVRRPVPNLPNFVVMTPVIIPFYGSATVRRVNAALVRWQVRAVLRWMKARNPVTVVTIPTAWDIVAPLRNSYLIFNRSDKHSAFGETNQPVIRELEENLLRESDRVLYVSHVLMKEDAALVDDRAIFLDHGVDIEHFDIKKYSEPADLANIAHPRIGFFGAIDDYTVDLELLEKLADEMPDVQLVLVGATTCSLDNLNTHRNIHWLDAKPYEDIPAYGAGFDVALMPWLDNEWIQNSNPVKMKEYLALGLPIVSTDFPEVHRYSDVIRIAKTPEAFVQEVQDILHGDVQTPQERRDTVLNDSWDQRTQEFLALLEER